MRRGKDAKGVGGTGGAGGASGGTGAGGAGTAGTAGRAGRAGRAGMANEADGPDDTDGFGEAEEVEDGVNFPAVRDRAEPAGYAPDPASLDLSARRRRRRARGRVRKTAVALVVLASVGAATVAALGLGGGDSAAGDSADSGLPPKTAKVTKQSLTSTESADGELGYGTATKAAGQLRGTLTWLPAAEAEIARGKPLYEVDALPVTLMYGSTPAYRALKTGIEGDDVQQLEENLSALGYPGFTVDEEYTSATADAVRDWQEDLGLKESGSVELGQVVFAPGAVRVDSVDAAEGDPSQPGGKVLSYTGTEKVITVELDSADQQLAKKNGTVEVTLPDDKSVEGRISDVSTVIDPGDGESEDEASTKVEVVVELGKKAQKAVEDYALASVDVAFTADTRENVLTVPVAALLSLTEGGFGVEVVKGSTSRYVPVHTGLFANGRVELTGDGIAEGTAVGVPK